MTIRIRADFNGLVGNLLCLSHTDRGTTETGEDHEFVEGDTVLAFELDADEDGNPAYLVASGRVVRSPSKLCSNGSVWSLAIDERGVRHVASLADG